MRTIIGSTIVMLGLVALAIGVVDATQPPKTADAGTLTYTVTTVGNLVQIIFVDKAGNPASAGGTCTPPPADDIAYGLTGYKFGNSALAYKLNTNTFPSYLPNTDVQSAISAAFTTVDNATSKALFTNGGTTTATPNKKDGVNTVGFGNLNNGTVGIAYGWYDSKTKLITEFDIVLSSNYTWSTNAGKTGDCGGASNAFDVQDIMTHEVGHPTGLRDVTTSADGAQSMYGYGTMGEMYKRDQAAGDKKGITTIYGQ